MSRTWNLWAYYWRGTYWHIGAKNWVELHGLSHPLVAVRVSEHGGDPRDPKVTHYGWEATDKPDKVTMIWPRAHGERVQGEKLTPWMSLDICFAYGIQAAISHGDGKMLSLCITEAPEQNETCNFVEPCTENSK